MKKTLLITASVVWAILVVGFITFKIVHKGASWSAMPSSGHTVAKPLEIPHRSVMSKEDVAISDADVDKYYAMLTSSKDDKQRFQASTALADALFLKQKSTFLYRSVLIKNIPDDERSWDILTLIQRDGSSEEALQLVDAGLSLTDGAPRRAVFQTAYLMDKQKVGEKIATLAKNRPEAQSALKIIMELGYGR